MRNHRLLRAHTHHLLLWTLGLTHTKAKRKDNFQPLGYHLFVLRLPIMSVPLIYPAENHMKDIDVGTSYTQGQSFADVGIHVNELW